MYDYFTRRTDHDLHDMCSYRWHAPNVHTSSSSNDQPSKTCTRRPFTDNDVLRLELSMRVTVKTLHR